MDGQPLFQSQLQFTLPKLLDIRWVFCRHIKGKLRVTKSTGFTSNDNSKSGFLNASPSTAEKGLGVCCRGNCASRSRFSRRKDAEEWNGDQFLPVDQGNKGLVSQEYRRFRFRGCDLKPAGWLTGPTSYGRSRGSSLKPLCSQNIDSVSAQSLCHTKVVQAGRWRLARCGSIPAPDMSTDA